MDKISRYLPILLLILIALISILYMLKVSSYWKITPDSSVYVSAAKSLAEGSGYKINGSSVKLYPPVTSLIYAINIYFFPDSYLSLNILTTIITLLAVYVSFFIFIDEIGKIKSLIIVLLSLGSIYLYEHSTYLLSDNIFILFCYLSLLYAKKIVANTKSLYDYLFFISSTLSACFTRIVGVAIPLSMLCYLIYSFVFNKFKLSRSLVYVVLITLVGVYLWESLQQLMGGYSYLKLFLQSQQWVPEYGYTSVGGIFHRFYYNLDDYLKIGMILSNGIFSEPNMPHKADQIISMVLVLFFLSGLIISLSQKVTILEVYAIIMLLIIGFYTYTIQTRWLFPILPLIFYYTIISFGFLSDTARRLKVPYVKKISHVLVGLYLIIYLGYSAFFMVRYIPGEHSSPFGNYPIKYTGNYDVQELAMWLRYNSGKHATYAAQHTELLDIITGSKGVTIPFEQDPLSLLKRLERGNVKYILIDKTKIGLNNFIEPMMNKFPDRFVIILDLPDAKLLKLVS